MAVVAGRVGGHLALSLVAVGDQVAVDPGSADPAGAGLKVRGAAAAARSAAADRDARGRARLAARLGGAQIARAELDDEGRPTDPVVLPGGRGPRQAPAPAALGRPVGDPGVAAL